MRILRAAFGAAPVVSNPSVPVWPLVLPSVVDELGGSLLELGSASEPDLVSVAAMPASATAPVLSVPDVLEVSCVSRGPLRGAQVP